MEAIVHEAVEKDRTLRYQHPSEIRDDLERAKRNSDGESNLAETRAAIAATA